MKLTNIFFIAFVIGSNLLATPVFDIPSVMDSDTKELDYELGNDRLYSIKIGNSYGFIDDAGKIKIEPYFEDAEDFNEGFGQVKIGGKWGFINKQGGFTINPIYEDAKSFSEGLATVKYNNKWGYIDYHGNITIGFNYQVSGDFHEGLAKISETNTDDSFGFIDKNGRCVISTGVFDDADHFSEGLAPVKDKGLWGYVNTEGIVVIPIIFNKVQFFSNGYAAVNLHGKWGYINKSGELITEFEYDYAGLFTEEGAIVSKDGVSQVIKSDKLLNKHAGKLFSPMGSASSYNGRNWMEGISDNRVITDLSIPGTHDSGAYKFKTIWARTQDLSIQNQLECGVRYLDIRIRMDDKDNVIKIYHGLAGNGNVTLEEALLQICHFLENNKSEAVICHFRYEAYDNKAFTDESLARYNEAFEQKTVYGLENMMYNNKYFNGFIWDESRLPTLKDVRGKLIYWRFYNRTYWNKGAHVHWYTPDGGKTGDSNLSDINANIFYSDQYNLKSKDKIEVVYEHLKKVGKILKLTNNQDRHSEKICVTYCSTQYAGYSPRNEAKSINPVLLKKINFLNYYKYFGIITVDFVDNTIADTIWKQNYSTAGPIECEIPSDIIIDNPNPSRDAIYTNFLLRNGHAIISSGVIPGFILVMQHDNNLVLYRVSEWDKNNRPTMGVAKWASNTCGVGISGTAYADLQSDLDNNFVIYTEPNRKKAIWATGLGAGLPRGSGFALHEFGMGSGSIAMAIYPSGRKPDNSINSAIWYIVVF